ncbi:LLM class flavin-dependent oxidoreductase [uncultured Friedmanniella sp.]|uniref:LLM class flavin-dependent oxidoreductase n=1 Tax=uncultured Friedmanniella sp. TaxID=335381 RepID=UPI0035CB9FCF
MTMPSTQHTPTPQLPTSESRLLASPNRLKLICFGFNGNGGQTITSAEGVPDGSWAQNLRIARAADAANFEAILPGARWAGFGGETNYQARSLETFAWAAAVSAVTSRAQVFATFHVPTAHPVRVAKTIATIDEISGGRFGLNIVAGWSASEIGMFGIPQREHDTRYEYADAFFEALDALFSTEGYFDHESDYFPMPRAFSEPKPVQAPRPVYMSAAVSPRGREFAARWSDLSFQTIRDFEAGRAQVSETKQRARDAYGRNLQVAAGVIIVCAETEKEAQAYFRYYTDEKGDPVAAENLLRSLFPEVRDPQGHVRQMPPQMMANFTKGMIAGHGAVPLIGTPEQVVEKLAAIADCGIDACTLGWVNFETGIAQYVEQIHPLMVSAGLRKDEAPPAAVDLGSYPSPRRTPADVPA